MLPKVVTVARANLINLVNMSLIGGLYFVNNRWFKHISVGAVQYFFICYFNDILAPIFLLSYSNILLYVKGLRINQYTHIIAFCVAVGLLWEFLAPLLNPASVSDWLDIVCYVIGGSIYWGESSLFNLRNS